MMKMNFVNMGSEFITCNPVNAEIIFVDEDKNAIVQEQTKTKGAKTSSNTGFIKDDNVELWVREKANKDCIKFFKPRFCISPKYPELGLGGYFLFLMTKPQIEFMKKYSERLVCVDRQAGENFEIVSLLILDDREECLPCAFMFTSEVTLEVFKVFFTEIKNVVGKVETKVFLAEELNEVVNIWEQVMETSVKSMICSWDILRDWTSNLLSVETQEKIDDTYKDLELLLEEKDINSFTPNCEALLEQLIIDPETREFGLYFGKKYASDPQTWACCYRYEEESSKGYNQLEKMHSTIQYILHTKSTQKINKALNTTLDFLRNKIYDRLILINNGKVSSKLAETRHRHKVAERMIYEVAYQNDHWTVTSRKKEQNIVTLCKGNCNCHTRCDVCNVCVHIFMCSCIDSVLKLNMCRHIHSVCMSEAAGTTMVFEDFIGGQHYRRLNSSINCSRRVKDNQPKLQKSPKNNSKGNQTTVKEKRINSKILSEESMCSLEMSEDNRIIREAELAGQQVSKSKNMQIVQSDLLEVVGHEVLITDQEETSEGSYTIYEMDNEVEVIDDSDTTLKHPQNTNMSVIVENKSVQSRKNNTSAVGNTLQSRKNDLELVFKNILNGIQSEEQLEKIENTISLLQNDVKSSSFHVRKRTFDEDLISVNESPKIPKIFDSNEKPLIFGKTVILKVDK